MSPAGPAVPPRAAGRAHGSRTPGPCLPVAGSRAPPNTGLCPRQPAVGSRLHLSGGWIFLFLASHACEQEHAWEPGGRSAVRSGLKAEPLCVAVCARSFLCSRRII